MEHYDILIIGGGAAGIAAAKAAAGGKVLLADRRKELGGVLLQCAHHGFGKGQSGISYAAELRKDLPANITLAMETTVLAVSADRTAELAGRTWGRKTVSFSQLILATGCYEIPIGALPISGTRPKGVYTAGQMQEMMNLHGYIPQGPVVILGSGDLGLIMAKQLAELGIAVTLVEKKDSCGGMAKNQYCLQQYPIELICGQTISRICGMPQMESVELTSGRTMDCRTLLVAAGLRPERELIHGLGMPEWLHICGNCNRVHPMVEAVIQEGKQAGMAACRKL